MWLDGKSCSAANHKPSLLSQPAHQSCKIQPICVCVCVLFFFANLGSSLERRGKFGALNNSNVNILNNITPPVSRKYRSRFVKYFIRVFEMFTNILVFCNFIANIFKTLTSNSCIISLALRKSLFSCQPRMMVIGFPKPLWNMLHKYEFFFKSKCSQTTTKQFY